MTKLGINIDHIATLRQARGTSVPDPVSAALDILDLGAQYIVLHLRKDRRHMQESDLERLVLSARSKIHLEMAASKEMFDVAIKHKPYSVCLVPEYSNELTTSGGLKLDDATVESLKPFIAGLQNHGIKVSLFIDAKANDIRIAKRLGVDIVELCTKDYSEAKTEAQSLLLLEELSVATILACELGLQVHSGHGLNYDNVIPVAQINGMECLNIGFAIIARSVFVGLPQALLEMRQSIA